MTQPEGSMNLISCLKNEKEKIILGKMSPASQQYFIVARADIFKLHFISFQVISTNLKGSNNSKGLFSFYILLPHY